MGPLLGDDGGPRSVNKVTHHFISFKSESPLDHDHYTLGLDFILGSDSCEHEETGTMEQKDLDGMDRVVGTGETVGDPGESEEEVGGSKQTKGEGL
ncbi:hypothetical protein JHK82_044770 [Glycine max]|uniref:Uncharacterized protein n=1 Tax=Glycine soja TaxID=3848 RepID=A0A0B2PXM7_GLYSO|nr:hypothetical protein JHK82_044770 [Glycine max]KHN12508.1 hypothetical protein glysoja_027894 [Glycine soja]